MNLADISFAVDSKLLDPTTNQPTHHKRLVKKQKKSQKSIEGRKDKHALSKFASDHLTFENKDCAKNAHDFTFNMTLTREGK